MADKGCKVHIVCEEGGKPVKDCLGTFKGWLAAIKAPMSPVGKGVLGCRQNDWKAACVQLFVWKFYASILVFGAVFAIYLLAGFIETYIQDIIVGIIIAFFTAWCGWYALTQKEPACCCLVLVIFESNLVPILWGILSLIEGANWIVNGIQIMDLFGLLGGEFVLYGLLIFAAYVFYGVVTLFLGHAALRYGMTASGIKVPEVPAAGAGKPYEEEQKPEVSVPVEEPKPDNDATHQV